MPDDLSGVIERITFHNLDSGYCVLRVQARGHREPVTVVGSLPQAVAGEYVEAAGDWVTDRTHGLQFKASELRTTPPHTASGIAKYLGSGLVKGIGPSYAKKIVERFGEATLDVIEESPASLAEVKGIGPKRIELIRDGWREHRHVHRIMAFLQSYGVGTARAVRIYKQYGETAVEQVKANPYRLSADIWGIGFRTADDLAQRLGIPRDSPLRATAAVRHVLGEASSQGHVGLPEPAVLEETGRLTLIDQETIAGCVEQLRIDGEVVRDEPALASGGRKPPVPASDEEESDPREAGTGGLRPPLARVTDDEFVTDPLLYLKPLFLAEVGVARSVLALRGGPHPLGGDASAAVAAVEARMGIAFAPAQRAAVLSALTEKFLVLTGGPGTGKTTIVKAVIELFAAGGQRVGLAAPTGRAAKRLGEATGREAKTVHRLLEYDAAITDFRRGKEHPLDLDLLVVDEFSMADVVLTNKLLRAVPPWACVLLVGDVDQLPSVGPGSVLRDVIDSGAVAVARLTQVHRQAGNSWIVRAAHAVNAGEEPESAPPGGKGDFYFVEADDEQAVVEKVLTMVKDRIPARFGLDPVRDVQVLSPMNKSALGVQSLNQTLQAVLNPPRPGVKEVARYATTYRVGDKVIQTRNNYQREVFNGDIGRVVGIEAIDQVVSCEFDGRRVEYEFSDLDELQLAYCISIHKSQGSEYPAVVLPCHTQHFIMLRRNLLYTGITRGKKLVAVVGSRRALGIAVRTADASRRFSLLKWRLQVQPGERGA